MTELHELRAGDRVRVTFEGEVGEARTTINAKAARYVQQGPVNQGRTFYLEQGQQWWESLEVVAPAEPLALGAVVEVCDGLGGPMRYIRISEGEPDAYAWTVVRRGASRQAIRRWSELRPSRVISTGVAE